MLGPRHGLGARVGVRMPESGVDQRERGFPGLVRVPVQQPLDDMAQRLVLLHVEPSRDQRLGGQQGDQRVVMDRRPRQVRFHAGQQRGQPHRRGLFDLAPAEHRRLELARARRVQPYRPGQHLRPYKRVQLPLPAPPQHRKHLLRRARPGRRPDRRLPYGGVGRLDQRQYQGQLGGHGRPARARRVTALVLALGDAAEQHQHVGRPDPGGGQPCGIRHGMGRGLVHRPLMDDVPVQLVQRLFRLLGVVARQRPELARDIVRASVGVLPIRPWLRVEIGENLCEIHTENPGTRH